ncbi:glycosyltransferase family 2 protein [Aerococcus agrisoli]|uniref:Glycosyltransferase family 2 protein n=1 Tax=Aerococcus agrisoli TaxID=2487350 RepID=A0A3N4GDP6_9LACT|nr:glycosyltransferase [Aerococcus agrisoli]RPA60919.1 glycosyltransferase family 2 protein [Aerococcus agrisoli]
MQQTLNVIGVILSIYMAIVIISYAWMLVTAFFSLRRFVGLDREDTNRRNQSMDALKPVSIIVPAYNESSGILSSVHSLLNLNYAMVEIIVVNDGSKDDTQEKMIKEFDMIPIFEAVRLQIPSKEILQIFQSRLHPHLYLIEKVNGGKADALNAGINLSHYPYVCSIDGDSILHRDALIHVMEPVVASNGQVVAAGGTIRTANEMRVELGAFEEPESYSSPLVLIQSIEYVRSFLIGRIALSQFNLLLIISGAFSIFDKQWVVDAGGYSTDMIGEDMELVVKIHKLIKDRKSDKKIISVPDPICYTEAPQSLSILRRQRRRWHQGLLASLIKHIDMLFNPKYGAIGMISMPYYWIVEAIGPVIEMFSIVFIIVSFFYGNIYVEVAVLLAVLFLIYSAIYTIGALMLDSITTQTYISTSGLFRMVIISLTEFFWYRPLNVFWRLEGIYNTIRGNTEWGVMERIGFNKEADKK